MPRYDGLHRSSGRPTSHRCPNTSRLDKKGHVPNPWHQGNCCQDSVECPLCVESLDETDSCFFPCPCNYQVCLWCVHTLRVEFDGRCPACRRTYIETDYRQLTRVANSLTRVANSPPNVRVSHSKPNNHPDHTLQLHEGRGSYSRVSGNKRRSSRFSRRLPTVVSYDTDDMRCDSNNYEYDKNTTPGNRVGGRYVSGNRWLSSTLNDYSEPTDTYRGSRPGDSENSEASKNPDYMGRSIHPHSYANRYRSGIDYHLSGHPRCYAKDTQYPSSSSMRTSARHSAMPTHRHLIPRRPYSDNTSTAY